MTFLGLMPSLGQLYTDDTNDAKDDENDDTNDTQWTNHDCLSSLACMPNEPKILAVFLCSTHLLALIYQVKNFTAYSSRM